MDIRKKIFELLNANNGEVKPAVLFREIGKKRKNNVKMELIRMESERMILRRNGLVVVTK